MISKKILFNVILGITMISAIEASNQKSNPINLTQNKSKNKFSGTFLAYYPQDLLEKNKDITFDPTIEMLRPKPSDGNLSDEIVVHDCSNIDIIFNNQGHILYHINRPMNRSGEAPLLAAAKNYNETIANASDETAIDLNQDLMIEAVKSTNENEPQSDLDKG